MSDSCNGNSRLSNMYKQICFASQQAAHKLVLRYTVSELKEKAALRHISDQLSLSDMKIKLAQIITKEMYILDVTRMNTTWSVLDIHRLARQIHIDVDRLPDTTHVCWMIALVLVRDKIKYEFTKDRHIRLL